MSHGRRLFRGIADRLPDPPRRRKRAPWPERMKMPQRKKVKSHGEPRDQAGEEEGEGGGERDRTQPPRIDGNRS